MRVEYKYFFYIFFLVLLFSLVKSRKNFREFSEKIKELEKKQADELDLIIQQYLPELVRSQNFLTWDTLSPLRTDVRIMQERLQDLMVEEVDNSFVQDLKNAIASTEKRLATKISDLEAYSLILSERATFLQNAHRRLDGRVSMLEIQKNKMKGKK